MELPSTAYLHQQHATYRSNKSQVSHNAASEKEIMAPNINYFRILNSRSKVLRFFTLTCLSNATS